MLLSGIDSFTMSVSITIYMIKAEKSFSHFTTTSTSHLPIVFKTL